MLLREVIYDDNSANNGEGFNQQNLCGPKILNKLVKVNTVGSRDNFIVDPVTTDPEPIGEGKIAVKNPL